MDASLIAARCRLVLQLIDQTEPFLTGGSACDDAVTTRKLQTEMGRFRVWSDNIGAHRHGRVSLDYRLRQSTRMRVRVLGLMNDLISALREALTVLSGQRRPYDEDSQFEDSDSELQDVKSWEKNREPDTEFGSIQREINSIVNYLYEISIIIRSSAPPRDLLRKAAEIDLSHFETWDVSHVKQKFPEGKSGLVERLGKANTRRRQVFRYLQNHHAKLSKSHGKDHRNGPDGLLVEEDQDSPSTPKVAPGGTATSSAFVSTAPITENTQTTVETFYDDAAAEILVDDAPSETTSAGSDGSGMEGSLHMPELPANGYDKKAFECPYCFEIMRVSGMRSWRAHVSHDLQPYICTFGGCQQSNQTFGTRSRWFLHEAETHRVRWQCSWCRETWDSKSELEAHLRSEQCSSHPDNQIATLAEMGATHVSDKEVAKCPLCMKEGQILRNHLPKHMQSLALFVLPTANPGPREDLDSNRGAIWGSTEDLESYSETSSSISEDTSDRLRDDGDRDAKPSETPSEDDEPPMQHGRWADFDLQNAHQGMSPLLVAATLDQAALVKLLATEPGANVEVMDNRGQTPLSRAAEAGASEVVRFLVTIDGINLDTQDRVFRRTPLSWSAGNGHTEVVRTLLTTTGIDVNAKDSYGRTPLWRAAAAGHAGIVQALLAMPGIDADACDRYGRSPLSWAAAGNHGEVILQLASTPGVDVNSRDQKSVSPLSRAAGAGQLESVRVLLGLPEVDIDAKDEAQASPLAKAAEGGHLALVRLLLASGVPVNDLDNEGKSPIMRADEGRHEEVYRVLLEHGAHLNPA